MAETQVKQFEFIGGHDKPGEFGPGPCGGDALPALSPAGLPCGWVSFLLSHSQQQLCSHIFGASGSQERSNLSFWGDLKFPGKDRDGPSLSHLLACGLLPGRALGPVTASHFHQNHSIGDGGAGPCGESGAKSAGQTEGQTLTPGSSQGL